MSIRVSGKALLAAVLFVISVPLAAQTPKKVLFDATHAQMVGNADWVIDEDTCGSPQRFPTPPQSGITASTPETYWSGGYSAFGVDLVKGGFQLETLPPGTATTYGNASNPQDLSNYNVFVIPEPNVRFTAAEKSAILAFVQNGGGLFMISDHSGSDRNNDGWDSPMIFNDLGSDTVFGLHFGVASDASNNIVDHPDAKYTADPASVIVRTGPFGACSAGKGLGLFNGTTITLNTTVNAGAKGHIWATAGVADTSTLVTFATSTYGTGRVAAIGDSSPSEDATNSCGHTTYSGWGETAYDNALIHKNAVAWLAGGGGGCADTTAPTATVTAPTATTVSGTVTISATGSDNVGVTGMALKIDGVTVTSSTTSAVSYSWNSTATPDGAHTITATATDACGNTGTSPVKSVTVSNGTPPGDTQLTSGATLAGQSVALGAWKYYYITVPSGATNLTLATTAATADVDIYTQFNVKPTSTVYACRPYTGSGNETCTQANPSAGTWWLGVFGYKAGSYSVTGTVTMGTGGGTTLFTDGFESGGWSTAQVSGTAGAWTYPASGTHPSQAPHGGTKLAVFNSYTSASGSQTRVYRATGFAVPSTATTVTLTFWMYHDTGYSTYADKVQAQVSTNGTTWTNAGTAVSRYSSTAGWAKVSIDLTATKGQTVSLGFLGISAYGNDEYIDDVAVTTN